MSFILDALRKSEHDRQREKGPGLAEVAVAAPRPKTNVWAAAAIALLLVNLVGVGVLLLHRASAPAPQPGNVAAAAAPAPTAATVAPPPATADAAPHASVTRTMPQPQLREPPPPAAYPSERNPLEREVSGQQGMDSAMAARAASVPAGPPAVSRTAAPPRGSVVYEPLPEAVARQAIAAEPAPVAESQQSRLPNAGDAAASGGMPNLHLDLHVYSPRPQERFVFVNSHKYREGDTLAEGPVIEQITQSGAVLSYRGNRFILTSN
jgi:general secretion pathway protein B